MKTDSQTTDLIWETDEEPPPDLAIEPFLEHLFAQLNLVGSEVAVLVTDDRQMRVLNYKYRGHDRSTDVLSFPSGAAVLPGRSRHLGDIVISAPQAARQAEKIGHRFAQELRFLVLHGVLHLLGHDHATDQGEMIALQTQLKQTLAPYFPD